MESKNRDRIEVQSNLQYLCNIIQLYNSVVQCSSSLCTLPLVVPNLCPIPLYWSIFAWRISEIQELTCSCTAHHPTNYDPTSLLRLLCLFWLWGLQIQPSTTSLQRVKGVCIWKTSVGCSTFVQMDIDGLLWDHDRSWLVAWNILKPRTQEQHVQHFWHVIWNPPGVTPKAKKSTRYTLVDCSKHLNWNTQWATQQKYRKKSAMCSRYCRGWDLALQLFRPSEGRPVYPNRF